MRGDGDGPVADASEQHHLLLDATDDDWAWRRRIRTHPVARVIYRALVFLVGALVIVVGVILVPAPGPGVLVIIAGLMVLASEFEFAQRLHERLVAWAKAKNDEVRARPPWVQVVLGVATFAGALGFLWLSLRVGGVPRVVPDGAQRWLHENAGL